MKKWTALCLVCLCSPLAQAASSDGVLFEITPDQLVPATQVEDSVFWYQANEKDCSSKSQDENLCTATVDHWDTVCFEANALDSACPAFENLFATSRDELIQSGAEEDVELVSCSIDSGAPVLTYNLWSFHGGSNVQLKDKKIPACPTPSK